MNSVSPRVGLLLKASSLPDSARAMLSFVSTISLGCPTMRLLPALALFAMSLSLPIASYAQSPDPLPSDTPGTANISEWMTGEAIPAVAGSPFSAKALLETVSRLEDGTIISHKTYNLIGRDSLGRTRNEARNWIAPDNSEPRLIRIDLYDPSTKTRTDLFPLTKIARQWVLGATTTAVNGSSAKPETTRENIGTQSMEGFSVNGTRVTQTYATGVLGNDRAVIIVTDYWYSPELRLNLLTKRNDPRHGEQTVRVTDLVTAEPDASLFDVPGDYKLVTEPAPLQQAQGYGAPDQTSPPKAGAPRAGVNAASMPKCEYCPNPSFSEEARAARVQGTVVLQVTVTPDGHAENVSVLRRAGYGLDEKAMEAVKTWRFRPAVGPNGNPVSTTVPIEVTFRLKL